MYTLRLVLKPHSSRCVGSKWCICTGPIHFKFSGTSKSESLRKMLSSAVYKFALISALLSIHVARPQKVNVLPCVNPEVTPDCVLNEVVINPCPKFPCQFKLGINVSAEITFTMNATATTASKATTVIHGIIGGVPVPFKTPYTDACATTGIRCPLKAKDENVYKAQLYVEPSYPAPLDLYVKWELRDQTTRDIFCFRFPAQLVR
ncbi:epididymal secretory protein E1-like [Acanthaster planci]|uniref:Epididymal secretory protein E1-like n=1 Tax=Acanthaster planci TaxID=133434 RepID=A0A8B7Z8A9_ACAPL|nr:epididymal secretory protein E1-like [Acanthaster planci]